MTLTEIEILTERAEYAEAKCQQLQDELEQVMLLLSDAQDQLSRIVLPEE